MAHYGVLNTLEKCEDPETCGLSYITFSIGQRVALYNGEGYVVDGPFHIECLTENFRDQGIMYASNPYTALSGIENPEDYESMVVRHGYRVDVRGEERMLKASQIRQLPNFWEWLLGKFQLGKKRRKYSRGEVIAMLR